MWAFSKSFFLLMFPACKFSPEVSSGVIPGVPSGISHSGVPSAIHPWVTSERCFRFHFEFLTDFFQEFLLGFLNLLGTDCFAAAVSAHNMLVSNTFVEPLVHRVKYLSK